MANLVDKLLPFLFLMFHLRKSIGFNETNTFPYCPPPAIFVFGDSLSDSGNLIQAFPFYADSENSPYGCTFFHVPTGRFSDGRLIIDFLASKWGFPFIEPYFKNIVPNYRYGINFAVSGATAQNLTEPVPFFLPLQTDQFVRFKRSVYSSLIFANRSADCIVSHVPKIEAFKDGTYMIFIGVNDILSSLLFHGLTPPEVKEKTVPPVVMAITKAVQDLHKEQARNFLIINIPPIGCTPSMLTQGSQGPFNSTDKLGCLREYNEIVEFANEELEKSLIILKKHFGDINIKVADLYSFYLDAISTPDSYGFEEHEKFKACCGYGGPFNYSPLISCGKNTEAKACKRPREFISWDGLHFTEAFSQQFVEEMMKGMRYLKHLVI